ncbi:MAG: hypothetical protein ACJAVK_002949 [Akkermansiaceae bacterium]|jgi:hypothetical protein
MKFFFFISLLASFATKTLANNHFVDRIDLGSSTPISFDSSLEGAGIEDAEPKHNFDNALVTRSRWWSWTAPSDGWFRIEIQSDDYLNVAIYKGENLDQLQNFTKAWMPIEGHPTSLPFFVTQNERLEFAVAGTSFRNGLPFKLTLKQTPPPASNDDFADRIILDEHFNGILQVETYGATAEPDEPDHNRRHPQRSLWWTITPTRDRDYLIEILNPNNQDLEANLFIFTGSELKDLRPACGCAKTLIAKADESYHIRLDQSGDESPPPVQLQLKISYSFHGEPQNDHFEDAINLGNDRTQFFSATFWNATREPGEADHINFEDGRILRNTTWWRWTAPVDGPCFVGKPAGFPAFLVVYESFPNGILVKKTETTPDDSSFEAEAGHAYYIVAGLGKDYLSELISCYLYQPLEIPDSSDPKPLGITDSFTVEANNIIPPPRNNGWNWTPLSGGYYRILAGPSAGNRDPYLYKVTPQGDLEWVVPDTQGDYFALEAETKYRVGISGPFGSKWVYPISAVHIPAARNDDFADAIDLGSESFIFSNSSSFGAGIEEGEQSANSTHQKTIWWKWSSPRASQWEIKCSERHLVEVFTGDNLDTLQQVSRPAYQSFAFLAEVGLSYHIRISTIQEDDLSIVLRERSSTPNNFKEDAIQLTAQLPATGRGSLFQTTSNEGEPGQKNSWWSWAAAQSEPVRISKNAYFIKVFEGLPSDPFSSLIPIEPDNYGWGEDLVFDATAGRNYLFTIYRPEEALPLPIYSKDESITLELNSHERPNGDRFKNRIILPETTSIRHRGAGSGATWSDTDPAAREFGNRSIWMEWTPQIPGEYELRGQTTAGEFNDDGLGVFVSNELGDLERIAFLLVDDDDVAPGLRVEVQGGQTYYLAFLTDGDAEAYEISIAPVGSFDLWLNEWRPEIERLAFFYPDLTEESFSRSGTLWNDGVTNFDRYLFNIDPTIAPRWNWGYVNLPSLVRSEGFLELRYRLSSEALSMDNAFFTHSGEVSRDGIQWEDISPINEGSITFVIRTPIDGGRKFLRFKAIEK